MQRFHPTSKPIRLLLLAVITILPFVSGCGNSATTTPAAPAATTTKTPASGGSGSAKRVVDEAKRLSQEP